ncbi:hypothetical protein AB1N83_013637, partial [Pleurotus pulmonarius]
CSAA